MLILITASNSKCVFILNTIMIIRMNDNSTIASRTTICDSLPCTINHSFSLSYAFKLHVHAHYVYVAYKQMKNVFLYKYGTCGMYGYLNF